MKYLIKRFSNTYELYETLIILFDAQIFPFIHTNSYIAGKNLMRRHCLKKDFYSNLNEENITDTYNKHAKIASKTLK